MFLFGISYNSVQVFGPMSGFLDTTPSFCLGLPRMGYTNRQVLESFGGTGLNGCSWRSIVGGSPISIFRASVPLGKQDSERWFVREIACMLACFVETACKCTDRGD